MFKINKVKPVFNHILTTANKYEDDVKTAKGVIIDLKHTQGSLKDYQTVLEVGPNVREVKAGDVVFVNPTAYAVWGHEEKPNSPKGVEAYSGKKIIGYRFNVVTVNDNPCLYITENDILYIAEGEEVVEEVVQEPLIYVPPTNTIIH